MSIPGSNQTPNSKPKPQKYSFLFLIIPLAIMFLSSNLMINYLFGPKTEEAPYNEFLSAVEEQRIHSVELTYERISYTLKEDTRDPKTIYYTTPLPYVELTDMVPKLQAGGA